MRYLAGLLSLATLLLGGYAWSLVQQRNDIPNIRVVGGDMFDAGTVSAYSPVLHTFKIINAHSFPVALSVPIAGCACTTASVSASFIPAGGSAQATVRVVPENGRINGSASIVTTHAGKSSEITLWVTGQVLGRKQGNVR